MSNEIVDGLCIPCGIDKPRRNTYFNGKFMTERDFQAEQTYHIAKQRVLNSALHGQGTVCGLKIRAHPSADCRDRFVYVEPGVAIDCCGREIFVPENTLVPVGELLAAQELVPDGSEDLFISICYAEQAAELVPVILPDCDCADQRETPNRIEECFEFRVHTQPPGQRPPPRPPIDAKLEWQHTINLADQSPRAIAVDEDFQQVYAAVLGDDGDGDIGARIYAYRMDNHDLITALNAGSDCIDLAVSDSGELIYLAGSGLREDLGAGGITGIGIYRESGMRTNPDPIAAIELGEPARLAISPRSGALFALGLETGRFTAWSEEAITDWLGTDAGDGFPAPTGPTVSHSVDLGVAFSAPDGVALRGGSMLDVSLDGRFVFVVDPVAATASSVRVVIVARLFANEGAAAVVTPTLPGVDPSETAVAVRVSRDSEYIFLLTRLPFEGVDSGRLRRFRWDPNLLTLQPAGNGARWPGIPWDLDVAPAEKWAYVSEIRNDGSGDRSVIAVLSVDEVISVQGDEATTAVRKVLDLSGVVRLSELDVGGRRLYVASDDQFAGQQPERGLIAVLDVEEADCGELFFESIDGCPECATSGDSQEHHCVVLAHLAGYTEGQLMQESDTAGPDDTVIDNRTFRDLVPASNRITEVIRCMLEEGFAEGVPGPRGGAGPQGVRGPGVTEVSVTDRGPGTGATVALVPIAGDLEGDQTLELGLPAGLPGVEGSPGAGITQVSVTTLAPGSNATAALEIIPADPVGNQRLLLGLPRGNDGVVVQPELTHVAALSWFHGRVSFGSLGEFQEVLLERGLVIAFDGPVLTESVVTGPRALVTPIFEVLAPTQPDGCWCPLPIIVDPIRSFAVDDERRIIDFEVPDPDDPPPAEAVGFRARLSPRADIAIDDPIYRVVLRADFILDAANRRAVDGNHIGGRVPEIPSGNGTQGGVFESWFLIDF